MDPLSTLSLVSSAIQIADFLFQLIAGTKKIYNDGNLKDHNTLEILATTLQNLHKDIVAAASIPQHQRASEEAKNIAFTCEEVARELIHALTTLKRKKQTVWESFRVALRAVLKKEEVERLCSKVFGFRAL